MDSDGFVERGSRVELVLRSGLLVMGTVRRATSTQIDVADSAGIVYPVSRGDIAEIREFRIGPANPV